MKSYSPYISKLNETLRLKPVSYGQEIKFNNLYYHTIHLTENDPNKFKKDDIFNIQVWPKKEKEKYKPKVYYLRVNFYFLKFCRKLENKKMLKIILLNMIIYIKKLLLLKFIRNILLFQEKKKIIL